jgi:hypothetical protein
LPVSGFGWLVLISIVSLPTRPTDTMPARISCRPTPLPLPSSELMAQSSEACTAAASSFSPLLNSMPERILKRQVVGSTSCQLSASHGFSSPLSSTSVMKSKRGPYQYCDGLPELVKTSPSAGAFAYFAIRSVSFGPAASAPTGTNALAPTRPNNPRP